MNFFVAGFLLFFIVSNFYLGYKFIHTFKHLLPLPARAVGVLWFAFASCPLVFRNEVSFLPGSITDFLYLIGAYWIALMYYGLMLVILCDIVAFAHKKSGLNIFRQSAQVTGAIVLGVLFLLMAYGTYNARQPKVTYYTIRIDKQAQTEKMRIALVSDLHLGKINDARLVEKMIALINPLEADVVLLAGDTFDSDINSVQRKQPLAALKDIKSKYGVYAIMGNHEYIQSESDAMAAHLEKNSVRVLIDNYTELPNGVFLYGRDDYSHSKQPLNFASIKGNPGIVLDHQPRRFSETEKEGADLLLCGHTHRGQMFPNNLITQAMYELDYGYKQTGNLNIIVTNGIGTWGPPVRIGNTSEVVCIDVLFTNTK